MKYIRTKNGIYEVVDTYEVSYVIGYTEDGFEKKVYKEDVIKQAETIEKLCDEFCYIKDDMISQYLTINFKFKREDEFCSLSNKLTANGIAENIKGISKYELQVGELKGAIWTSKGLIYVAKMNEDGVLCLI